MNDLKFAFRQLLKNPGFTAVAVLTLALGIGANTAIFSVIDALMLKTLPVRQPEQLVMLWTRDGSHPRQDYSFYHPMFVKFRELNQGGWRGAARFHGRLDRQTNGLVDSVHDAIASDAGRARSAAIPGARRGTP